MAGAAEVVQDAQNNTDDDVASSRKPPRATVLLYSDDRATRAEVRTLVGRRAAVDSPLIDWVEAATDAAVIERVEQGGVDLVVLDGEAAKVGGMGLCRTLKSEVYQCPPVLLLIARQQDAWLASWSEADAVVAAPLDPVELQEAVAGTLRGAS